MKIVPTYIDKRAATVDIPYPEAEPAHLKLDVPMGRIMLDPGAGESIISGKVTYNIEEFKPTYSVKGRTVQIRQRQRFLFPIGVKFVNDWEFMLGDASPFSLEVNTGAAQAELNLGGIPLTGLTAESGAGDLAVNFDMPNPARIKQAKISTGAGRATLKGLLNANVERLKIGAGVGQFIAHFTGAGLIESGKVRIDGGVGEIVIVLDETAPIRVKPSMGLGDIRADEALLHSPRTGYQTASYEAAAHKLDIEVSSGVGAIRIELA